jgi:beta-glucosidase
VMMHKQIQTESILAQIELATKASWGWDGEAVRIILSYLHPILIIIGTANYPYLDTPIDAIKRKVPGAVYYSSDNFPSGLSATPSDIAIVFINSDAGENTYTVDGNNGDRSSTGLYAYHNGDKLVQDAAAKYSTVIVVVHTVGPILVEKWIDLPSVKAVLFAHLPGQEAGNSLTDILFGDYSPSGHLPYSIPKAESDYPDSLSIRGFELFQVQDTFSEGLYIDYRYLNKQKIKPRFAFGHGLSYTTFTWASASIASVTQLSTVPPARAPKGSTPVYSNAIPSALEVTWPAGLTRIWRYLYPYLDNPSSITVSGTYPYPKGYTTTPKPDPPSGGAEGGNPALWDIMFQISVKVSNTGSVSGKVTTMVFVQYPDGISWDTPIIQLRAFGKSETLAPGQSQTITLEITRKDISIWDVVRQNWVIPTLTGNYRFWIGEASDKLTLACESVAGTCSSGRTSPA